MSKSNKSLSQALASASSRGVSFFKSRELVNGRKAYRLADAAAHGLDCNRRGYSEALFTIESISKFTSGAQS